MLSCMTIDHLQFSDVILGKKLFLPVPGLAGSYPN